ncbi:MAG: PilZ domain-containing protein [Thermodesulfobacteriota bacterium]|nr:PilZ domain-containing protein [Thermodesulfobacteriota bacterium]
MSPFQRRAYKREQCEIPVLFSPAGSDRFHSAIMRNYSLGGVYIESQLALSKGMSVFIQTGHETPPQPAGDVFKDIRPAEVRWCMAIADTHPQKFGCGIQYRQLSL